MYKHIQHYVDKQGGQLHGNGYGYIHYRSIKANLYLEITK